MKHRLGYLVFLLPLAGCVDTPDSIARECRNVNNECIDALMMVTDETMAKRMTIRVFTPMKDRFDKLDEKWDKTEKGWGRKISDENKTEVVSSDNVHLYLAELRPNAQRFSLELARIRNLLNELTERAKDRKREAGENPADVKPQEQFQGLYEILNKPAVLGPLRTQFERPKLVELLNQHFKGSLNEKQVKIFNDKQKQFAPKEAFQLVR